MVARIGEARAQRAAHAEKDRERLRAIVSDHEPLLKLLEELYPQTTPPINATDREIGAYIGEQRLLDRLRQLLREARGNPNVIRG